MVVMNASSESNEYKLSQYAPVVLYERLPFSAMAARKFTDLLDGTPLQRLFNGTFEETISEFKAQSF